MFAPLTWLFSPVYRWLAAAASFVAFIALVWWDGRRRGVDALQEEQREEAMRRAKRAIEADNNVRRDVDAGRLYENDGHRRD